LCLGQVELENLPLKKDALKSLELAVEVKHGIRFYDVSLVLQFYFLHGKMFTLCTDLYVFCVGMLIDY